jgi:hypothetical protein
MNDLPHGVFVYLRDRVSGVLYRVASEVYGFDSRGRAVYTLSILNCTSSRDALRYIVPPRGMKSARSMIEWLIRKTNWRINHDGFCSAPAPGAGRAPGDGR